MIFKILVLFLVLSVKSLAQYFENPYNHKKKYDIGGYKTFRSYILNTSEGNYEKVSKTELQSRENINNGILVRRKSETTKYPSTGVPEANTIYGEFFDDELVRSSAILDSDIDGVVFDTEIGKSPTSSYLVLGETWEIKSYLTVILGTDNSKFHGTIATNSQYTFEGLETIDTIWGQLVSSKIRVRSNTTQSIEPGIVFEENRPIEFNFDDQISEEEELIYYIKGLGVYKSLASTSHQSHEYNYRYLDNGYGESIPTSAYTEIEERNFIFSNMQLSVENFKSLSASEYRTNIPLNSWTWNGAFPWVFSNQTNSWFYYHFAGSTCNAYDVQNGVWLTFNQLSNSWVRQ